MDHIGDVKLLSEYSVVLGYGPVPGPQPLPRISQSLKPEASMAPPWSRGQAMVPLVGM